MPETMEVPLPRLSGNGMMCLGAFIVHLCNRPYVESMTLQKQAKKDTKIQKRSKKRKKKKRSSGVTLKVMTTWT
ncbi:hypothetical protein VN97_g11464 [Penicillium thymicola]|uniref:Uncharacterized protein n=1 Tax=Penicillium thymicola TaxID=293382 RepID=A0AAI9T7W5_PENTH|nr:hypothetical protein VN97_g11464 [Penicillium thymicola]